MATLTVQQLVEAGITPSFANAAAGGDTFPWALSAFVHVKNGDTVSHTVTVTSHAKPSFGEQKKDLSVSVGAGAEKLIGPLHGPAYRNTDGDIELSYDAVTSVTVAALKVL